MSSRKFKFRHIHLRNLVPLTIFWVGRWLEVRFLEVRAHGEGNHFPTFASFLLKLILNCSLGVPGSVEGILVPLADGKVNFEGSLLFHLKLKSVLYLEVLIIVVVNHWMEKHRFPLRLYPDTQALQTSLE